MKILHLLLTTILFFGCHENKSNKKLTLDFDSFSIQIPEKWQKVEFQGLDSEVGGFITENNDTIRFDLGYYSNNLEDRIPILMDSALWESSSDEMKESYKKANYVMVKDVHKVDNDIFRTTNIAWDTIDGLKCKIKYPIINGKGITGVYFDSISQSEYDKNIKLTLYGINLNVKEQEELQKAIKTIKFKK